MLTANKVSVPVHKILGTPREKNSTRPLVTTSEIEKGQIILPKHSSCRTSALGRITRGSHITYYSLMFFIAYTFNGQVPVFAG